MWCMVLAKVNSAFPTNPVWHWYKVTWRCPCSISLLFPPRTSTSPNPQSSAHACSLWTRSAAGHQRSLFWLWRPELCLAGLCVPELYRSPLCAPDTSTSHAQCTQGCNGKGQRSIDLLALSVLLLWSQCTGHLQPRTKKQAKVYFNP